MPYSSKLAANLRQDADLGKLPLDRFRIRAARSGAELIEAFSMLHEAYVGKGLQQADRKRLRITAQHVLRESVVFVAWDEMQPIGTVSVTADSPAALPLDKDYGPELAQLRAKSAKLVEIGSLAVKPAARGSGANLLLGFVAIWAARRILGGSHIVIGVNPNHANLYRAVYGFVPMGEAKAHAELDAPVTGLVCDLAHYPKFLRDEHEALLVSGRTLEEEFCRPLPPSCVEVVGALLSRRRPELWNLPRAAFHEVFVQRSGHIHALDATTRRYLEAQRGNIFSNDLTRAGSGRRSTARQHAYTSGTMKRPSS